MRQEASDSSARRLASTVIEGGYCVGCGACSSVADARFSIRSDESGRKQALAKSDTDLDRISAIDYEAICPFGAKASNEDEIAKNLFDQPSIKIDARAGRYSQVWAGHVREGSFRENGSSGGMASWLAAELLRMGKVDAVLHVKPDPAGLFHYAVSTSIDELMEGAKSRYYPVEASNPFERIQTVEGSYAFIGLPCFVKAARLLSRENEIMRRRLRYTISIVCGHLKTSNFAKMFAWQLGVEPSTVSSIDFRKKNKSGNANQYAISVQGLDSYGRDVERSSQNSSFFGYLWSHGFFKYHACDYCDDILGETADISVGDAWLPQFISDPNGSNLIVSRHEEFDSIVTQAVFDGRLDLCGLTPDDAVAAQDAGFRHRREGLVVRLENARQSGRWTPPKRSISSTSSLPWDKMLVYLIREKMAQRSHSAFSKALETDDFSIFVKKMKPWMALHDAMNAKGLLRKFYRFAKTMTRRTCNPPFETDRPTLHSDYQNTER